MRFIIISAVYNMADVVAMNIAALKQQTMVDFEAYFGDDLSTDNSCEVIAQAIAGDPRFHLVKHAEKMFSLGNIARLIDYAKPNDEDVLVLIDGDDLLATDDALATVRDTYQRTGCWMTYGNYADKNYPDAGEVKAYPARVIEKNLFRSSRWRASHLKTFKFKLWRRIKPTDFTISRQEHKRYLRHLLLTLQWRIWRNMRKIRYEDLLNPNQSYVRRCSDKYITIPMLEMAGDRIQYIAKVLYCYHGCVPHPEFYGSSPKKWSQRLIRNILTRKPHYQRIEANDEPV
jgi:glycosyltransferase involved in cell wall biosynthesis